MENAVKKLCFALGAIATTSCSLDVTAADAVSAVSSDTGAPISTSELTQYGYPFPQDLEAGASETEKANYAWRLFIAAMQQTSATLSNGSGRGEPSGQSNFIQTGTSPAVANPLVFESFYHRTEAFPYYNSGDANPACQNKPASPIGQVPTYHTYVEVDDSKTCMIVEDANYVYTDETNEISQNFLYYQNSYAPDFPVLFMAKVNTMEASYALSSSRQAPSSSVSWDFPDGVIEVKTAWRRVQDIKHSDPRKYHQVHGTYLVSHGEDQPPQEQSGTLALIAIHIIQKTANYPEFIFTTFEHVDSVTRSGSTIVDPAYKTTYNKLAYETPSNNPHYATALGAYNSNVAGMLGASNQLRTYTLPDAGPISQNYTTVVQPYTIVSEVNDVNNQVNAMVSHMDASNVWANYRLKGVQAGPSDNSDSPNYFLANIVVESSQPGVQLFNGILLNGGVPDGQGTNLYLVNCRENSDSTKCVYPDGTVNGSLPTTYKNVSFGVAQNQPVPAPSVNMGGCQGCHGAAQQLGRDFSFLANGVLGKGKEADAVPDSALPSAAQLKINQNMAKSSNFDLR